MQEEECTEINKEKLLENRQKIKFKKPYILLKLLYMCNFSLAKY